jgi:hypothetical protein
MEKITTSIIPSAWAIIIALAFYVIYAEGVYSLSKATSKRQTFFLNNNQRKIAITVSFGMLLIPFLCSVFMHLFYDYPIFRFSQIKGGFEAISYLSFPMSSGTVAIVSRFSLPAVKIQPIEKAKPFLLIQQNIPKIQTLEEKEEYFEQAPINSKTNNLINDSEQTFNERIVEAKDSSTENTRFFFEKYSYMIDCSFEIFTNFVNGNVNLAEPIKLKSKSKGDRNTTKTAIIKLIYDIFPFEDLKTSTRIEHLFLINQKYKCFENICDKKEISRRELINFENKRKKESEKVKHRK